MANAKFIGDIELIDKATGELICGKVISQQGRRNFYIAYMCNLLNLFDVLGGKKYKVLKFIVDNMDSEQKLVMTTMEMERKSGVCRKTISETLKLLERNNLIVRKTGAIMLNPKLFNNRSAKGEQYLLFKYEHFNSDE